MNTFQSKLYELRKQKNYTQEDLAKQLHVSRQAISKWENGVSYPSMDILSNLAKVFNVSIDELFNQNDVRNITFKHNKKLINFKKMTIIISILILIILTVSVIGLVTATKAYQMNEDKVEEVVKDFQVGMVVITSDKTGEVNVDVNNLRESGYPYHLNNVENNVILEDSFGFFKIHNYNNKLVKATIYLDRTKINFAMIASIYQKPDNSLYIKYSHWVSINNITKFSLKTEENNNSKETNFELEVIMINSLVEVKVSAFDINHSKIDEVSFNETMDNYNLPKNTLYLVVENKFKDSLNEFYYTRDIITSGEVDTGLSYVLKYTNDKGTALRSIFLVPEKVNE